MLELISKLIMWTLEFIRDNWKGIILTGALLGGILYGVIQCKDETISDLRDEVGELTAVVTNEVNQGIVEDVYEDTEELLDKITNEVILEQTELDAIGGLYQAYSNVLRGEYDK